MILKHLTNAQFQLAIDQRPQPKSAKHKHHSPAKVIRQSYADCVDTEALSRLENNYNNFKPLHSDV